MHFFDIDSPVIRFMTVVYELILLNIYFLATCVLTLGVGTGAGMTAMIYAIYHGLRREEGGLRKLYFKSLKMNFKQVTPIWILMMFIAGVAVFNILNVGIVRELGFALIAFQYVVLYEVFVISIYLFCIHAKLQMTNLDAVKSAFIMSHKHLVLTLLLIAFFVIETIGSYMISGLYLILTFSLWAYVLERVVLEGVIIKKYVSEDVRESLSIEPFKEMK